MKITIGAVTRGGSSLAYKTGDWREQRPIIDMTACKACGICRDVCPDTSVFVKESIYVINYDYCKGCGLCAHECPADAIRMVPEEK
ncbi:MAG: 4Fe-4S binding protein [Deltaproteobacteria bacterium]|nr:4Fe-4S binding protein [Deltaproteobacteria bacterium]MBW1960916.1 4Fe-4S binding protein [Deltaproteobacteria bacterium]MBW1992844.1 4Fe-4S binding protein [Deltaproteobacteria bacterium]MBW2152163.1 4Fe-4S binding protein [Deltaproteobacteria bacterium]